MKISKLMSLLSVLLICTMCKEQALEPYWSEEKLVSVLADLRIIDGQIKKHIHSEKDSLRVYYKELLYDIYNINENDIVHHLNYVQNDPFLAKRLEDEIQDLLSNRLEEVQNYK